MFDAPAIEKTYRGTLKEVRPRLDEIPDASEVELHVLSRQSDSDGQTRLQKVVEDFFAAAREIADKERRPVNEVSAQLAEELVRQARFPEIEFRDILGERVACVKGRLEVWQFMMVARHYEENTVERVAKYFDMSQVKVRCALDYYAAYPEAIDAALAENDSMTYEEMKRRYPMLNIQLHSITDEDIARIEEKYPSLKNLDIDL